MRYNGIIILRIRDFREFFTFDEFWKNRQLFPIISKSPRFRWASADKQLDNECIDLVKEWLGGGPINYCMESAFLYKRNGTYLGRLDEDVYRYLSGQEDPIIASNLTGLCALYQLLPKDDRLGALQRDIDYIRRSLLLADIDFSKSYIDFEEAGKTMTIPVERTVQHEPEGCHWVLMHNASEMHKVCFCDAQQKDLIFKIVEPSEYCLALFDGKDRWISEKPFEYTCPLGKNTYWRVMLKVTDKRLSLVYREIKDGSIEFERTLSNDIVSYAADSLGCVFLVKDLFKPIQTYRHPDYDSDVIRRTVRKRLEPEEQLIDLTITAEGLEILTSKTVIQINKYQL